MCTWCGKEFNKDEMYPQECIPCSGSSLVLQAGFLPACCLVKTSVRMCASIKESKISLICHNVRSKDSVSKVQVGVKRVVVKFE